MMRPSRRAILLPPVLRNQSRMRWLKSPPTPVQSTKVTMQSSRTVAIQNLWYLRKLVNGLKAMCLPRLKASVRGVPGGRGLDTARSPIVWVVGTWTQDSDCSEFTAQQQRQLGSG